MNYPVVRRGAVWNCRYPYSHVLGLKELHIEFPNQRKVNDPDLISNKNATRWCPSVISCLGIGKTFINKFHTLDPTVFDLTFAN
jgi:hypothetical protein